MVSCDVTLAENMLPFGKVIGGALVANGYVRETVCRPSLVRRSEMQVGRVRLNVKPDDFGEWSEALKGTRILLLEVIREKNNPDSSDESESGEETRSEGMTLKKVGKGERYSRLGHFQEVDETKRGWLFEGCEMKVVVTVQEVNIFGLALLSSRRLVLGQSKQSRRSILDDSTKPNGIEMCPDLLVTI